MTATLAIETLIARPRGVLFDILVDLRGYDAWLPRSVVFKGTSAISSGPTRVGTEYIEESPWGTRTGIVTALDRPTLLAYRQPMRLRPAWLGNIDIEIRDTLDDRGPFTAVRRMLTLRFQGPVRYVAPLVAHAFRAEVERMHDRLKSYAEDRF